MIILNYLIKGPQNFVWNIAQVILNVAQKKYVNKDNVSQVVEMTINAHKCKEKMQNAWKIHVIVLAMDPLDVAHLTIVTNIIKSAFTDVKQSMTVMDWIYLDTSVI